MDSARSGSLSDVVIVGAGIIGLATALRVIDEAMTVTIVDPRPGSGATWAGAGMLAPGAESTPEHQVLAEMARRARSMWPDLARSVTEEIGDATLHEVGSLFVGWDASDLRDQRRYFDTASAQGISSRAVTRDSDRVLFEGVSERLSTGTFVSDDAYIDPDSVVSALLRTLERRGARIVLESAAGCSTVGGGVEVRTVEGVWHARCGIVATGVHSPPLGLLKAAKRSLRPVRGVTVRLHASSGTGRPMVRALVEGRMVYVIRRDDGSIVVGASSDESSELIVETNAVRRLLDDAVRLLPELDYANFVEARVGLRPATVDHLPFFEQIEGQPWAWSSGHYRHGFLLAPLAANDGVEFAKRQLSCN